MKREKANYLIQSVTHALDILESFTRSEKELGVTELSKRLGLHKNNVFRLLATLEHRGYIEQNKENENYRLGPRTLQLGSVFIEQRECRRQARPILERLAAESGETAVVAVLRSTRVVFMDGVETDRTVRAVSRVGSMLQAHCTAVGKAQLAYLPADEIERSYGATDLPTAAARTLRSREELMEELNTVRQRGYAVEDEECDVDVRGVAAPVRDFAGNVIAAIGILAPASRLTPERITGAAAAQVVEAARTLSSRIGHRPGPLSGT